ncbi:hypothetical protein VTN77DRAFT_7294 [Rasamsonia byssochlamydoides]|uniref:uncharacterized protein n=1 Tax=Rasamsonia byssochlamydoides TaxID=89139 RepID=UPI0037447607
MDGNSAEHGRGSPKARGTNEYRPLGYCRTEQSHDRHRLCPRFHQSSRVDAQVGRRKFASERCRCRRD